MRLCKKIPGEGKAFPSLQPASRFSATPSPRGLAARQRAYSPPKTPVFHH
jgi:hypothetical protein